MKKASVHKKQSEFNEEAAKLAAQSGYYDWAVTICFYAALHYVEAYARHNGDNIGQNYRQFNTQHERRLAYVTDVDYDLGFNNTLIASYEKLYQGSKTARYLEGITEPITARKYFKLSCNDYFKALSEIKTKLGKF